MNRPNRPNRLLVVLAALVCVILVPTATADAAVPETTFAEVTFPGSDACTGEAQMVTLAWTIRIHGDGQGATVLTLDTTVSTSTGWSGSGTETQVATGNNVLINNMNIRMTNDDGAIIRVRGHRVIDLATGEVTKGGQRFTCVRQ